MHEAGEDGEEVVEEVHVDGVAVRRYAPGQVIIIKRNFAVVDGARYLRLQ